jgi:uncharacterized membrane protein YdbT with pleckstrin-like domain
MTYIEHGLGRNETLEYRAHLHWLYKAGAWSALVLLLAIAAVAYARTYHVLAGLAAIAGGILFLAIMLPVWTTEIGVTNQRLICKRGLIRRRSDELQLRAVEGVQMIQGVLGRLFNYGRIELQGTGVSEMLLPPIADPLALRKALQEAIGAVGRPSAALTPLPDHAAASLRAASPGSSSDRAPPRRSHT